MVVHRIAHHRPAHRVVGAEGREPLAGARSRPVAAVGVAEQVVRGQHQLVEIGVGMAAVDEPFAPGAGRELAFADGRRPRG